MTGVEVTELHTQDGWDWPNGVAHEGWPAGAHQPAAPYFREQYATRCILSVCQCARYSDNGLPKAHCAHFR